MIKDLNFKNPLLDENEFININPRYRIEGKISYEESDFSKNKQVVKKKILTKFEIDLLVKNMTDFINENFEKYYLEVTFGNDKLWLDVKLKKEKNIISNFSNLFKTNKYKANNVYSFSMSLLEISNQNNEDDINNKILNFCYEFDKYISKKENYLDIKNVLMGNVNFARFYIYILFYEKNLSSENKLNTIENLNDIFLFNLNEYFIRTNLNKDNKFLKIAMDLIDEVLVWEKNGLITEKHKKGLTVLLDPKGLSIGSFLKQENKELLIKYIEKYKKIKVDNLPIKNVLFSSDSQKNQILIDILSGEIENKLNEFKLDVDKENKKIKFNMEGLDNYFGEENKRYLSILLNNLFPHFLAINPNIKESLVERKKVLFENNYRNGTTANSLQKFVLFYTNDIDIEKTKNLIEYIKNELKSVFSEIYELINSKELQREYSLTITAEELNNINNDIRSYLVSLFYTEVIMNNKQVDLYKKSDRELELKLLTKDNKKSIVKKKI